VSANFCIETSTGRPRFVEPYPNSEFPWIVTLACVIAAEYVDSGDVQKAGARTAANQNARRKLIKIVPYSTVRKTCVQRYRRHHFENRKFTT